MHRPRPVRLPGLPYVGGGRYHVRTSTSWQHPAFTNAETVAAASGLLLQIAEERQFAVFAYCFMPDHVHVLLDARDDSAALRDVVKRWKQASGYWYARRFGPAVVTRGDLRVRRCVDVVRGNGGDAVDVVNPGGARVGWRPERA